MIDMHVQPCPFCGACDAMNVQTGLNSGWVRVCQECGAEGPTEDTWAQATRAWNTRADVALAPAPPMAALGPSTPGNSGTPTNTSTHTGDQPL